MQTTAGGLLPALSGINLTNVDAANLGGNAPSYYTNASNIVSGTLADGRLSSNVALQNGANIFTAANLFQGAVNSTTAFQIQNSTGTSNLLIADTINTRLAVGASPATSLLTVGTNTTTAAGGITFGTDTNLYRLGANSLKTDGSIQVGLNGQVQLLGSGGTISSIRTSGTSDLTFRVGGTDRAIIDSSGNVGIGTLAPVNKLDVAGRVGLGVENIDTNGGFEGGVIQARVDAADGGATDATVVNTGASAWEGSNVLRVTNQVGSHRFYIRPTFKINSAQAAVSLYAKNNGIANAWLGGANNGQPSPVTVQLYDETTSTAVCNIMLNVATPASWTRYSNSCNVTAGNTFSIKFWIDAWVGNIQSDFDGIMVTPGWAVTEYANPLQVTSSGGGYIYGNLGIGTTAPSAKLEVRDNTSQTVFASATKGVVHIQGGGLNNDYTSLTFGDTNLSPTGKIAVLKTASGSYLQFGTTNLWGGITNTALSIDYNGGSTFRNGVNSTTGFQIQNAAASPLFVVDTINSRVGVGGAPVNGPGDAFQVVGGIRTSAASIRIPNGSVLAIQQDSGARGGISSLGINIGLSSTASTYGTIESSNAYGIGLNINGVTAGSIAGANGAALFRNTANSTTGFQVQNAAGTALLNNDTTNMTITVGSGTVMPSSIFATKVDSTTGASPWGTISGDFNGDGKTDAIVTNYGAASASVYINTGSALPATATSTLTTGTGPTSVSTGDFNGDGKKDVVVNNYTSGNASVYINTGSALPTTATYTLVTGSQPIFSTVGDFNGDGKTDLVITNNASSTASVYINTGSALPTTATSTLTTGSSPMGISSGDFNGDGKTDVILANSVTNNVMVYTNTGSGLPTTASSTHTGVTTPHGIAVGDFNGDGKTDAIIANNGAATAAVFINTGAALPATASSTLTTASAAYSVYTGDFNGDGKTDAATANYGGGAGTTSSIFINSGAALPVTATNNLMTGLGPVIVGGGDFNGDGRIDLISANIGATTASVFINTYNSLVVNGQTTVGRLTANGALQVGSNSLFQDAVTIKNLVNSTSALSVQNTAGVSLMNADTTNMTVTVGAGAPAPSFAPKIDYADGNRPVDIAMGDVNGDSKADIVTANPGVSGSGTTLSVLINNGNGTYAANVDYTTGTGPTGIALADVNGDGKLDIAVANQTTSNMSVLINNGNGTFAAKVDYATGTDPWGTAMADVNGDGKADIVTANTTTNNASVFINNGNGTFAAKVDYTTGNAPRGIFLADVNTDGKPDILTANNSANTSSVLINNGNGTFAAKVDYATGTGPFEVASADVNGDNKPDIVTVNSGANSASVLINNGTGTFAAKVDYTVGTNSLGVALGDVNSDGRVDIVTANGASNSVSVLVNGGNGAFVPKVDYATGGQNYNLALGDVNGDGRIDMAAANNTTNTVSVLMNSATSLVVNGVSSLGRVVASGALQVSSTSLFQDAVTARNSVNSTSAFSIQNTAGQSLFNIDTLNNSITIGGNNSGTLNSWIRATSMGSPRHGHTTVSSNGYVYAMGGVSGVTTVATTEYAKINADGTLGAWTATTSMGTARRNATSVVANGYVYAMGGRDGASAYVATTEYAKINADGTLGAWTPTTSMGNARYAHSSVTANGYVYAIGGYNGTSYLATTEYAKINADGTLGAWTPTTSMGTTKNAQASVVANGYVYALGGFNGTSHVATTEYAKINTSGTLGAWTPTTSMGTPRSTFTPVVANGYVYALGGYNGTSYIATTEYAKINTSGTLGAWTATTSMGTARGHVGSLVANGYVYAIGGYDGANNVATTEYASTQRIRVGGALDLVGLGGANLADGDGSGGGNGSTGGELTAGNTNIIGTMIVQGAASFGQSASIGGNLSAGGDFTLIGVLKLTNGTLTTGVADVGGNAGFTFNTTVTYATAKLLSVKNNGVEKFAVDKDGRIITGLTPSARAYNSSNITLTTNTPTALALNSERWDNELIHDNSTNNSRLTAKTAGLYTIEGNACFAANSTSSRNLRIRLNGTTNIGLAYYGNAGGIDQTCLVVSTTYQLSVNDYVELVAEQNSGGNLDVTAANSYSPEMSIVRVGP